MSTLLIILQRHLRIDEALVWGEIQLLVSCQYLTMQGWVDVHGIFLYQLSGSLIIALALDALNLGKQFTEEMAELLVIIHLHIGTGGDDIALCILES